MDLEQKKAEKPENSSLLMKFTASVKEALAIQFATGDGF